MLSKIQQSMIMWSPNSHCHRSHDFFYQYRWRRAWRRYLLSLLWRSLLPRSLRWSPFLKRVPFMVTSRLAFCKNECWHTLVLGETKAYYSESESVKRTRGTRVGLLFAMLIPDRRHNADQSSFQSEYFAVMGKKGRTWAAILAPKAVRPSSVAPPVQGSCVIFS